MKNMFKEITVLYIEDDPIARNEVSVVLKSILKTIYIVTNEIEAVKVYKENKRDIDLILCAMNKPNKSALELLKQIRINDKKLPFILLSNYNESQILLEAIKYNVSDILSKPTDIKELIKSISVSCCEKFSKKLKPDTKEEITSYVEALNKVAIVSKTDLRGNIIYVNDIFCEIAQYDREELIGKSHNMVRHPDMPKAAFQDLWNNLKEGKKWQGKVKNLAKDGSSYFVNATISPLHDCSGEKVIGYIGIRFLTTDDENEKREFKKRVMINLQDSKKKEIELLEKIDFLERKLDSIKYVEDDLEHEQMRSLKLVGQINYYEEQISMMEEKNAKMISNVNTKIAQATKGKSELKEKNDKLAQTIEEKEKIILETTELVKKLEDRVSEQMNKIADLKDVIAHREAELKKKKKIKLF
ncbi:PAS domain-containing protein [Poseidonibacter sp.]|uniref:PAS domain-containing protein n=1 Tax=Poseidonibacter sp. TaxID=2321188 RepID=UPI003C7836F5